MSGGQGTVGEHLGDGPGHRRCPPELVTRKCMTAVCTRVCACMGE